MKKLKNIAVLHPTFSYGGGAENLILWTLQDWHKEGIAETIYTRTLKKDAPSFINQKFAKIDLNILTVRNTVKYLAKELSSFDAVLIHNFPATIFFGLAVDEMKKNNIAIPKSFWYCHEPSVRLYGYDKESYIKIKKSQDIVSKITSNYDKLGVSKIDYILSNSHRTKNHIETVYGREATVIYPGIKIENNNYETAIAKHFFYVGRIEKAKNIDIAIRAYSLFLKEVQLKENNSIDNKTHDIKFLIAGRGSYKEKLKTLVKKLNLEEKVIFLGFISDEEKSKYLRESYAMIMPSEHEPFGLTIAEAWNNNTTAIISGSSGVSEIAYGAAMIADMSDERMILKSLMSLVFSDNLRTSLVKKGREIIESNILSIETHAKKLLDYIETNL